MALHIYLAPHLDDAVFSCGGLMARQAANDEGVTVVTVCAGDTPVGELTAFAVELHRRWGGAGSPIAARRAEDRMACGRLGASAVHLEVPDAVYRRSHVGGSSRSTQMKVPSSAHFTRLTKRWSPAWQLCSRKSARRRRASTARRLSAGTSTIA